MMKRAKVTEARALKAADEKSQLLQDVDNKEQLKIHPLTFFRDRLVELSDVSVWYGDVPGCRQVSLEVRRGERVALDGVNGSGKTTVLRLIEDPMMPHTGRCSVASGLILSKVDQRTSGLRGDLSGYARAMGLDETLFFTILRKLGFPRLQLTKEMQSLSSGQQKKVLLATSLSQQAHLYIWDEPLNYIDIISRQQIEELILRYQPTMLFVEHDETFCRTIATRTVELA